MTSHVKAIAAALALSCLFGLGPSRAQQSIEEGAGDPSTPLGRSMIQNQQDQQQEQQNQQRDQQNWQDLQRQQQRQMDDLNQSNQQPGYYQAPTTSGGPYGAIYIGASGVKPVIRYSYNYPTLVSARVAAQRACQAQAGVACREALVIKNSCAGIAVATNGMWAARAASLDVQAADEAMDACHASSKRDCDVKAMFCVPNNN